MQIPVVNENDEIIGYKDKKDRNLVDITRISSLWVTSTQGDILLAQRALHKTHSPGLWGPAVAGTVEEGETYESNIIKEAEEEIGLKDINPILGPKLRRTTSHSYFTQWFTVVIDKDTKLNIKEDEVAQVKWFTKDELLELYAKSPEIFLTHFKQYIELFLN